MSHIFIIHYVVINNKKYPSGDGYSARFLIQNGSNVNAATTLDKETSLHMVAAYSSNTSTIEVLLEMANIAKLLLSMGADPNAQNNNGRCVETVYIFLL